jgi:hypothetical protein
LIPLSPSRQLGPRRCPPHRKLLAFTINLAKQRVGHEALWNRAFRAQNVLGFIRILFAAFVTTNRDLVSQHRRRRKCVGFGEWNVMLVGSIPFVMEAVVFADNDPKIVGVVEHRVDLQDSHSPENFLLQLCTAFAGLL